MALFGRSTDVKQFGFERFFHPLLNDLKILETDGIFVDQLNENLRGSVFIVCADNLGAHSLAGFQENLSVDKCCRFCLASKKDIQTADVQQGCFQLRTPELHDLHLQELTADETLTNVNGVKADCVLRKHLSFFHPVTGFPPDLLHDFFEGIVPFEIALCVQKFISEGILTLEDLNNIIQSFPYANADKVNRPQTISRTFAVKKSIGGMSMRTGHC